MDFILPINTYHFDRSQVRNERPYGAGIQTEGGLFAMGFKDSKYKPSWAVGQRFPLTRLGPLELEAALFAMTRSDVGHYRPFPGVLPILSVGDKWRVESTVIPKLPDSKGPIAFTWLSRRGLW